MLYRRADYRSLDDNNKGVAFALSCGIVFIGYVFFKPLVALILIVYGKII